MAVLIEGISVVIKCEAIHQRYTGGWKRFVADAPNETLCSDDGIARVGFMIPADVEDFVKRLASFGIEHLLEGRSKDLVVVDQQRGFSSPCDWALFGRIEWEGDPKKPVAVCQLSGSSGRKLFTPPGWKYENSLTANFHFVKTGWVSEFMQFLRHENGLDVYRDLETGKEVYIGRISTGR